MKLVVVLMLLAMPVIYNESYGEDSMESYKNEAKSRVSDMQGGSLADVPKSIKGYDSNPKEASLDASELRIKADDKMKRVSDDKTEQDKIERQAIQGVKSSISNLHKSEYTVEKMQDKDFIKTSTEILKDPIATINTKGGAGCKIVGDESEKENIQFEEYWVDVEDSRIRSKNYKCEEDEDRLFECHRSIKSIKCASQVECSSTDINGEGGIEKGSVESDMQFTYNYPILTIGTISDNYWGGQCKIYDRSTKFKVRNIKDISEFRLTRVGFDDYIWIKVNDHTVHVGPFEGDRIELTKYRGRTRVTTDGNNHKPCELNTNQNYPVNIDLKPYLKEGENEIWMRVLVHGAGEGWMQIKAKQYCCTQWNDEWIDDCPFG